MSNKRAGEKRFEGHIPGQVADKLETFLESYPGVKKKDLLRAMAELFLELPRPTQAEILLSSRDQIKDIAQNISSADTEPDKTHLKIIEKLEEIKTRLAEDPK